MQSSGVKNISGFKIGRGCDGKQSREKSLPDISKSSSASTLKSALSSSSSVYPVSGSQADVKFSCAKSGSTGGKARDPELSIDELGGIRLS